MDPQVAPELPGIGAPVPTQAPEMPERSLPFGKPEGATGQPINLPNYQQQWQSGEAGPGLSPKPTKWDKFTLGVSEGAQDSFLGTLSKVIAEKTVEKGTTLPPDQANALNPYRDTPYTTPMDSGIVAMEAADGRRKQQVQEWLGRNDQGNFVGGAGRLAGGFIDAPMYAAIGALTGGIGALAAKGLGAVGGAAAGEYGAVAGSLLGHYGQALAEFSGVGEVQNKLEAGMGAKEKSFGQVVQESLGGAAIATGLGMLARKFLGDGKGTPEQLQRGIKENAAAITSDEKLPISSTEKVINERAAGVTVDPNGNKITPTVNTSPIAEAKLYGATHGDGVPLVHEHGLGEGQQFTDAKEVANNGVSRSTEIPGQIHETKLPENSKLLDLDKTGAEDYNSKESLLKQIEEKTGVPLDAAIKNGESLKDIITNLGDWAGADIGKGTTVPEDILKQVQDIAKEQGYNGYAFKGENSRTVHMFDAKESGMQLANIEHADPSKTPELPSVAAPEAASPEGAAVQEKLKSQAYNPNVQEALNKIRKTAMTMHPDDLQEQINDTQKILDEHKKQLQEMAKSIIEERAKPSEETLMKPKSKTLFHGTRVDYEDYDYTKSGGVINLTDQDNAQRYAIGGGGNRARLSPENAYLVARSEGIVHEYDPTTKIFQPIGLSDSTMIDRSKLESLKGNEQGIHIRDLDAEEEGLGLEFIPKNARVIEHSIEDKNILDTTSKAGLNIISELKPKTEWLKIIVDAAKFDMANGGSTQFSANFWSMSKFASEGSEQATSLRELTGALQEQGYDGIHFNDDRHKTVALFEPKHLSPIDTDNPAMQEVQDLRAQEVHDKRMLDLAKRIMTCGATE